MEALILVSADGHAGGRPQDYVPYFEPTLRDQVDALYEEHNAYTRLGKYINMFPADITEAIERSGAVPDGARSEGGWDVGCRLKELDREGVAAEVLHSGHHAAGMPFFHVMNRTFSPEIRAAGARAYHRWLFDFMADGDGRLFGVADSGPCLNMDETVKELRWVAEHGFVSVGVPGYVADPALPALSDSYFDPYWAACEELGLVLSVHIGFGTPQGLTYQFFSSLQPALDSPDPDRDQLRDMFCEIKAQAFQMEAEPDTQLARLGLTARRPLWQLIAAGVFDRHPDLKLVFTETRADWLPATLAYLDRHFTEEKLNLDLEPSEYFRRNVGVAASSTHRAEVEMRNDIGLEQLMFGVDFPHTEGTWPNTFDWIRAGFGDIPENEARMILGENAIRWYRLDRDHLVQVARRIGPLPDQLLGDYHVNPDLIATFDYRAAYSRPAEVVHEGLLGSVVDEDLALGGVRR